MAAPTSDKPVNGNYGAHQGYAHAEAYQPGQVADPSQSNAQFGEQSSNAAPAAAPVEEEKPIPKEMIGWYFVEQYYNTMSKEPKKLYLYYTKKSQFVAGNEAEKVNVAVGQRSISERIKELDIQDCKVRVSNVDSQESAKGILVQVIGEVSNRAAPHRKFVQTFVLAEQPTGYFVLNDIFRYIIDEEEEIEEAEQHVEEEANGITEEEAAPAEAVEAAPATLTSSDDPLQQEHDAELVKRKLEEEVLAKPDEEPPAVKAAVNGIAPSETPAVQVAEDAPVDAVKEDTPPALEEAAESAAVEDTTHDEKPRDPDSTPIASPPKPKTAVPVETPAAPPKPAAPKTWANLVASQTAPKVSATSPIKAATPAIPAPLKPKTANSTARDSTPASAPTAEDASAKAPQNGNSGWQTAGGDTKQRQGRQHSQSISSNQENVLGYVKNVTDKVDASILKATLSSFGKLAYFDVSRPKNCAFVEFENSAAYNACVFANPHNIGGEQIFVEERRPRGNAYGGNFNGRGGARGGRPGPNDRTGSQGGRGGAFNKDGGRGGGYGPRGRGGSLTPRGRGGQPQAA